MKTASRILVPALPLAFAATLSTTAFAAPVDCAAPRSLGEARACQYAARGIDELRLFIERTRRVYGLYIMDFDDAVPRRAQHDSTSAARVAARN